MTCEISLHNSWMGLMEHRLSPSCRRSNLSRPIHQRRDASVGGTFYIPVTLSSDLNKWVVARSDTSAHAGRRRRLLPKYTRHPNATIRLTAGRVAA